MKTVQIERKVMNLFNYFKLYDINKNGLYNSSKKKCICDTISDYNVLTCPNCKKSLDITKMICVDRNSAIRTRTEIVDNKDVFSYSIISLISKGFEFKEVTKFVFVINKTTLDISISDINYFKAMRRLDFKDAFDKAYPGFISFVENMLDTAPPTKFNPTKINHLSPQMLSNLLYFYLNYKGVSEYISEYKLLHYGNLINFKEKFPNIDFNDKTNLSKLPFDAILFATLDIKNPMYIDSLIELYNTYDKETLDIFESCVHRIYGEIQEYDFTHNKFIDIFSMIYNKEISLDDFLRIYQHSPDGYFKNILHVKKMVKDYNDKNFEWQDIEKIDEKTINTVQNKVFLKKSKVGTNKVIEDFYKKLESNPFDALDILLESPDC